MFCGWPLKNAEKWCGWLSPSGSETARWPWVAWELVLVFRVGRLEAGPRRFREVAEWQGFSSFRAYKKERQSKEQGSMGVNMTADACL